MEGGCQNGRRPREEREGEESARRGGGSIQGVGRRREGRIHYVRYTASYMHTHTLARSAVELVLCGIDTVAARAVVGSLTGWLLALGVNDAPFVSIHVHTKRHGGEAYWLEILLFSFYCKNMDKDTDWKDAFFSPNTCISSPRSLSSSLAGSSRTTSSLQSLSPLPFCPFLLPPPPP